MPSHNHIVRNLNQGWIGSCDMTSSDHKFPGIADSQTVSNTGGNQAHNNMPPYLVVHMWERTA